MILEDDRVFMVWFATKINATYVHMKYKNWSRETKKNAGEENDTHKAKAESKFLSF